MSTKFKANPFGFILEHTSSPYSPHTRTLRSSFLSKVYDTFSVLFGSFTHLHNTKRANYRAGVLDYLFLGLPLALWRVTDFCDKKEGFFAKASTGFFFFLAAVLWVAKAVLAFVLTLPALIFVGITHFVAWLIAGKERATVLNVNNQQPVEAAQRNLHAVLHKALEQDSMRLQKKASEENIYQLVETNYNDEQNHEEKNKGTVTFIEGTYKQAFFKLNVLHVLEQKVPHEVELGR